MPSSTPSLVGETGRFTVRRRIGTGAYADVFEALDRKSQQRVALKLVRSHSRTSPERSILEREFATLQRIRHPSLARCYELFLEDRDAFFTMELVEGSGFVEYVRADARRELPGSDFMACSEQGIVRLRTALPQLVRGIDALHAAGVVHRDLHPGNVRVTFGGRVVVIDYGLASDQGTDPAAATSATVMGSAAYAAPEQHEHTREPASDWYSVGVLLFESLTGGRPFAGNDHEVFVRKRTLAAPTARSLVPSVPEDLDRLCSALLERDPGARPDANAILTRLEGG